MGEGTEALIDAIEAVLSGESIDEAMKRCDRVKAAEASTLLDLYTSEQREIVEAYRGVLCEGVEYLAEALAVRGEIGLQEARLLARVACGSAIAGDGCVLTRVLQALSVDGRQVSAGSVVCLEPLKAVAFEVAGVARIIFKDYGCRLSD